MNRTIAYLGTLALLIIAVAGCSNDSKVNSPNEIKQGDNNLMTYNIPTDRYYTNTHEWIKVGAGDIAYVGITSYSAASIGTCSVCSEVEPMGDQIIFRRPPKVITNLTASISNKSVYLPVDGILSAYNPTNSSNPSVITSDPYYTGWIFKLSHINASQLGDLMTASQYAAYIGQ